MLNGMDSSLVINASKTPILALSLDIASPVWPTNPQDKQKFDIGFFVTGKYKRTHSNSRISWYHEVRLLMVFYLKHNLRPKNPLLLYVRQVI